MQNVLELQLSVLLRTDAVDLLTFFLLISHIYFVLDVENALQIFKTIIKEDPYCLDNMDTFSNLLYVREMKVELAYLAHRATEIDKYRLETCCIVGESCILCKKVVYTYISM